jgi:hypothetical protein
MMTTPSQTDSKEQLLAALTSSMKMLLVSLAFVVIVVSLLVKSLVGFGMVALQALNLLLSFTIAFVASAPEVSSFARFLATATR